MFSSPRYTNHPTPSPPPLPNHLLLPSLTPSSPPLCPHQQFIFVSTTAAAARVSHPRLLVLARKRSTARFVQTYIDLGTWTSPLFSKHLNTCHQPIEKRVLNTPFFGPSTHPTYMSSTDLSPIHPLLPSLTPPLVL
jgi:hypothetical protein